MKYSEDTDAHRKANIDYVNQRWKQLHGLEVTFGSEGIRFLFLVNAGAALAVLAFHKSFAAGGEMLWPTVMLGLFVFGVIIIGLLYFARFLGADSVFRRWRNLVIGYFTDAINWSEIVNDDIANSQKLPWAVYLAYVSFACFVIGAAIGIIIFSTQSGGAIPVEKIAAPVIPAAPVAIPAKPVTNPAIPTQSNDTPIAIPEQHKKEHKVEKVKAANPAKPVTPVKPENAVKTESTPKPENPAPVAQEKAKPAPKSFGFFGD
jgi:hypothetical protein